MFDIILAHILAVSGVLLVGFFLIHVLREHRTPSSTLAWIISFVLLPYIAIPFYFLFGDRKVARARQRKAMLYKEPPNPDDLPPKIEGRAFYGEMLLSMTAAGLPDPTRGNKVSLMANGQKAYFRLMEALELARSSIRITAFILGRDDVGRAIVEVLARKARQGVDVKVLLDALGCMKTRWGFVDPIRKAGGKVGIFMPILPLRRKWSAHLRTHRKLVLVDEVLAVVGGMNLAEEYMGPLPLRKRWADIAVEINGPAVRDFTDIFAADWLFATGEKIRHPQPPSFSEKHMPGQAVVQAIASGPDADTIPLHDALMIALMAAKKRIWVATPYFVPDANLSQMLRLQARMGRDVRVLVPEHSNHKVVDFARGAFIRDLAPAGIKFYAYRPGMMHAKAILVDDDLAFIGSANFDIRSLYLNYEVGAVIYSPREVANVADLIQSGLDLSRLLSLEELKREGWIKQTAEDASRILAPYL